MELVPLDTIQSGVSDPPQRPLINNNGLSESPAKTPIKPSTNNGKYFRITLILTGTLGLGFLLSSSPKIASQFFPTGKPLGETETTEQAEMPQAAPQNTPLPDPLSQESEIGSLELMREAFSDNLDASIGTQRERVDNAMADLFITQAKSENRTKGTPYEIFLFRKINSKNAEVTRLVAKGVDVTSYNALKNFAIKTAEFRGLLIAYRRAKTENELLLQNGKVTPQQASATPNYAPIIEQANSFAETGMLVRELGFEQAIRNEQQRKEQQAKIEALLIQQRKLEQPKMEAQNATTKTQK